MKTEAIGQIISGATLGFNTAVQKKAEEEEKAQSDKRMQDLIDAIKLQSPDTNSRYNTLHLKGWNKYKYENPSNLSGLSNLNYGKSAM